MGQQAENETFVVNSILGLKGGVRREPGPEAATATSGGVTTTLLIKKTKL